MQVSCRNYLRPGITAPLQNNNNDHHRTANFDSSHTVKNANTLQRFEGPFVEMRCQVNHVSLSRSHPRDDSLDSASNSLLNSTSCKLHETRHPYAKRTVYGSDTFMVNPDGTSTAGDNLADDKFSDALDDDELLEVRIALT